ncbi:MAG TPA: HipA N-terminal domain-containing protein [Bacteroidota bacterium]|nr:HipA N-terminal domain-containing protein [Bacteroidota bacterium]
MSRTGQVFFIDELAGRIVEDDAGYHFRYDEAYLRKEGSLPVSQTLPLRREEYFSRTMIPFFDGLIPEGWLLGIAQKNRKLDPRDRIGLLLACCKDCIGAVSVAPHAEAEK